MDTITNVWFEIMKLSAAFGWLFTVIVALITMRDSRLISNRALQLHELASNMAEENGKVLIYSGVTSKGIAALLILDKLEKMNVPEWVYNSINWMLDVAPNWMFEYLFCVDSACKFNLVSKERLKRGDRRDADAPAVGL
jgi:hypothetical protein